MQLQNSYIFLPNPHFERPAQHKDKKDVIYVEVGRSFPDYLLRALPGIKEERKDDFLFEYIYSLPVTNHVETTIIVKNVGDSYYVNVIAVGGTKVAIIRVLENIHNRLFDNDIKKQFIAIPSYDAVSEYYCNKLYPKLNKLERQLRRLMFNIYVLEFGRGYFLNTVTEEMQNKITERMYAKGNKPQDEIKRITYFFYWMEYADMKEQLFTPHWTKIDDENKEKFLHTYEDLSKLSDEELRTAISAISPKSDWERFFAEKVRAGNIEDDIETVRIVRNKVAHCRLLKEDKYIECNKIINALNRALSRAITITEEKDFANKNAANLEKAMSGFSSRIHEAMERLHESVSGLSFLSEISPSPMVERLKSSLEVSSQLSGVLKSITSTVVPKDYFAGFGENSISPSAKAQEGDPL